MRYYHILILSAVLGLGSCGTDNIIPEQKDKGGFFLQPRGTSSFDEDDIHVSIVANGVAFSDQVGTIEIAATFNDSSGNRVYADSFLINDQLIEVDSGVVGLHRRVYGFDGHAKGDGEALFGDSITVELKQDENLPSLFFRFRLPELVNFIVYDHGGELDPNENLTVTWYPDLNNADDVQIGIMGYNDNGLKKSFIYDYWETADDGQYTIPKSDLQQFANRTHVKVGIVRSKILEEVIVPETDYDGVVTITIFDGSRGIPIK